MPPALFPWLSGHLLASSSVPPLHISDLQAIILGILQGVTELFPLSSLGHTVIYPSLFGWHQLVVSQSQPESHWLGFVVMLHVGSALGLLGYFWRDWILIIRAWFRTLGKRRIETPTEMLSWLIVISSIPAGILGLALEREFRILLAKPIYASVFLMVNGTVLFGGELARRRVVARGSRRERVKGAQALTAAPLGPDVGGAASAALAEGASGGDDPPVPASSQLEVSDAQELTEVSYLDAVVVGVAQSTALIAGMSRDGVCMTAGLSRGLSHYSAARFAFLLATPIIFAAGFYKLPDFLGPNGAGIRVPGLLGLIFAAIFAVVSVHWLVRWFKTRTLAPFATYCLLFGLAMTIYLSVT